MFAPDDLATMGLVRQAFDPEGLANPGKIFPTPRSCGESARRQVALRPARLEGLAGEGVGAAIREPLDVF
jgi:glycolate oxidase